MKKIHDDAFAFWVLLGEDRTYAQVAAKYEVSQRAVVKAAARERWAERLAEVEKAAREQADRKLAEGRAEMLMRHRRMLQAMAARAIKAISEYPLTSGMEGMRAAEMVIKLERLVAGEASERTEHTVASVTRQEIDRLVVVEEPPGAETEDDPEEEDDGQDW